MSIKMIPVTEIQVGSLWFNLDYRRKKDETVKVEVVGERLVTVRPVLANGELGAKIHLQREMFRLSPTKYKSGWGCLDAAAAK